MGVRPRTPGWGSKRRMDNFNILVSGGFQDEDLVNDGWTEIIRNLLILARRNERAGEAAPPEAGEMLEIADFQKMEQIRARVDKLIADPATAEALKPYYRQFCKRPCFHDEYLDAFNRPSVTLVDTAGRGVERIVEHAVWANGQAYEIDCLIYATGFEVGTEYTRRSGYELHGRGGVTLTDRWADGVRTLHGMHARDFPNLFHRVQCPTQGSQVNFPHMLE